MITYSKVGLHGTGPGVGDFARALGAAGRPFHVKSISNAGWAVEAAQIALAHKVEANIILRWPQPAGRGDDHPILMEDPILSADQLFESIEAQINMTPEIRGFEHMIRIEPTNEISTADIDPSWIGYCLRRLGERLLAIGWSSALGGFNNGQPKPADWTTPGMRSLLEFVAEHPGTTISVHEGKTTTPDMEIQLSDLWDHLVGRFTWILQAADQLRIPRPEIEITEWGWAYNDMPGNEIALRDVDWLATRLAQYPEVRAAYLWNLDTGWGDLGKKLAAFIPDLLEYNMTHEFETSEPTPPEVDYVVRVNLLDQEATTDEKIHVVETVHDQKETQTQSADDAARIVAPGLPGSTVKVWEPDRWADDIEAWLNARGVGSVEFYSYEGHRELDLKLTAPLSGPFTIPAGGRFNDPRDYSFAPTKLQLHEGLDFAPTGPNSQAIASAPGRVIFAGWGEKYGYYVKVEHTVPVYFVTYYAHMDELFVRAGDQVQRYQSLGRVGSTGNSSGGHVHMTVRVPEYGLADYVVADVVDPEPHMDMTPADHWAPIPPPATEALIGLHATADPQMAPNELGIFDTARPEAIKVLSNLRPEDVGALAQRHPKAQFIVRAFLSFWENGRPRGVSPSEFVDWTITDVARTLDYIEAFSDKRPIVELHNEPNLSMEGLWGSWGGGIDFGYWYLEVKASYERLLPGYPLMFPGLSPGHGTDFRVADREFWTGAASALRASTHIGLHRYWGVGEDVYDGLRLLGADMAYIRGLNAQGLFWVTEASEKNNSTPFVEKGKDYLTFWRNLPAGVGGVTYFVASATHPDFQSEVWVDQNGFSYGIAEVVGGR